jgi:hypothetical protein
MELLQLQRDSRIHLIPMEFQIFRNCVLCVAKSRHFQVKYSGIPNGVMDFPSSIFCFQMFSTSDCARELGHFSSLKRRL